MKEVMNSKIKKNIAWILVAGMLMLTVGVREAEAYQTVKGIRMPDTPLTGKSFEVGAAVSREDFEKAYETALMPYNTVDGGLKGVPYGSVDGKLDCMWLIYLFLRYDLGYSIPSSYVTTPHPEIKERWDEYLAEQGKQYGSGSASLFSWYWYLADESERFVVTEDYTIDGVEIKKPELVGSEVSMSFSKNNASIQNWLIAMEDAGAIRPGALILWTKGGPELVHGGHLGMYVGNGQIMNTRSGIEVDGVKGVSGVEDAIYNMYSWIDGSTLFGIVNIMEKDARPENSVSVGSALRFQKLDADGQSPVAGAKYAVYYHADQCPDLTLAGPFLKTGGEETGGEETGENETGESEVLYIQNVTSDSAILLATGETGEDGYLYFTLDEELSLLGTDGNPIAAEETTLGGENYNLPFGHYVIVETESAPGHLIDRNCYYRELTQENDEGNTVEVTGKSESMMIYLLDSESAFKGSALAPTNSELQLLLTAVAGVTTEGAAWMSSDERIASVDQNGLVNVHRYGTVRITATTVNGEKAEFTIDTLFYDVAGSNQRGDADYQYYYDPVYWAADHGITTGYDGVYFGPQLDCQRREMLIFLWRMAGEPTGYGDAREYFNDLLEYDISSATNQAVAWAYREGITRGYEDGGFHPTASINRKDTLILLYRLAGKPAVGGTITFPDVLEQGYKETQDTYRAILWAGQNKITGGYSDGSFRPFNNCLREHIVTFLYRYARLTEQK